MKYSEVISEILKGIGGKDNIQGVAHCATRLRIVLKNNDLLDLKK